jgi:hypothetical protein
MNSILILILVLYLSGTLGCSYVKESWFKSNESWALSGESSANPAKWEIRRKISQRSAPGM